MKRGAAGKRRDANEWQIIRALRSVGASVEQLSAPDLPDLLVGFQGDNLLLEVKTPRGKLRKGQELWAREWRGMSHVVRTPEDAFEILGIRATMKVGT